MDPVQQQLEALKLLKDWSVWMVTVETAAIAFLGAVAGRVVKSTTVWFPVTIVSFAVSIVFAAWVLSGIPSVAQQIDGSSHLSIYKIYKSDLLPDFLTLNFVATIQHTFFVAGILGLAILIICHRLPPNTGQ